ncbi:esterase family protein [Nocardioides mangrovicus]|uniref:Esterase family protein n=1 Tax=Nocardioides mangrovicus TaxID=2478913 RepID=A0A3L8P199_9ACTN|nr:alpha/beta hydrolase family protein [Nocardioides mangrovicus]RLV48914.1 esterase family protein [Nocardioides mangrovicus]
MARIRCDFFADSLELSTSMTVLLPQPAEQQIGTSATVRTGAPPVLYLLHGLSDDDTAWTRYTGIERYAEERGLAVVMPQVHRSFYTDLADGHGRYWTFLTEELPALVERFFRVSTAREDTFVAGLSMGGFGSVKWALHQPQRFAAAASMSGALDLEQLIALGDRVELFETVLAGRSLAQTGNDLYALADRVQDAPALYVGCGTDDVRLLPGNEAFAAHLAERGLDVTTDFSPGEHVWSYWDAAVQRVLAWLPLDRAAA